MAIRSDTIYRVQSTDSLGNLVGLPSFAVTDDEEGMYWYDTLAELAEDRGDERKRIQSVTHDELETLRYGPREE